MPAPDLQPTAVGDSAETGEHTMKWNLLLLALATTALALSPGHGTAAPDEEGNLEIVTAARSEATEKQPSSATDAKTDPVLNRSCSPQAVTTEAAPDLGTSAGCYPEQPCGSLAFIWTCCRCNGESWGGCRPVNTPTRVFCAC
jgi:hypothetical protein